MTIATLAPLPYLPGSDNLIGVLLLGCFLLSAYVLAGSRKLLTQLGKEFLLHRERVSIFNDSTSTEMHFLTLLFIQAGVLAGLSFFCYSVLATPEVVTHFPATALLGLHALAGVLFLLLRWGAYYAVGWVFFDEQKTGQWLSAYSTLVYHMVVPLFFLALIAVYMPFGTKAIAFWGILVAILMEILVFYKWLKLFCTNLWDGFLLILYFCALEAIPYLLMFRFLLQLNKYIIINY